MTLISCLMPVGHRREHLAPIALRCFLAQTYPERELIVFDDQGVIEPYPSTSRITVIRSSRQLDVRAKLCAMVELAQGELLARWDDDDYHYPRRLEAQIQALQIKRTRSCYIHQVAYVDLRTGKRFFHQNHCLDGTMVFQKNAFLSYPSPRSIFHLAFPDETPAIVNEPLYLGTLHGWNTGEDQPRLFEPDLNPSPLPEDLAQLVGSGYCIRVGYHHRSHPRPWQNEPTDGRVWQPDVYVHVADQARNHRLMTIVDFGCGLAGKLSALAAQGFSVLGLDQQSVIELTRKRYPDLDLRAVNLERLDFPVSDQTPWAAVAADVIEHLHEPEHLLRYLVQAQVAVISTPDRILTHGHDHDGPPPNPEHVREWSAAEFQRLIIGYLGKTHVCQFDHTRSNDRDGDLYTLMATCVKKKL